jgi:colanic acid/amylovoran biosynthesis glycosyltransferase
MKVLHYCNFFSPVSQTFIYDVIIQLDSMGVSDTIVANKLLNQTDRPHSSTLELPVFKENIAEKIINRSLDKLGFSGYDWQELKESSRRDHLKKIIQQTQPDVVHAHFGPQGYLIVPVTRVLGISLVVSFHGFDAFRLPKEDGWPERLSEIFQGATIITVVSGIMRDHLIKLGCPPEKLRIIHVGKKLAHYSFSTRERKIINFISIGRLTEKKGHLDTVNAFLKLNSRFPDLSLKIIGEGELMETLLRVIEANKLEHKIQLLGSMNHQEAIRHLEDADAFILCSKVAANGDQEGIPTVLMEAQAMGLPCISTLHSGIPEVIPAENHWMLAEEASVDSIADKIEKLVLSTPEEVLRATYLGHEKVKLEFNLEIEVNKLKELYDSIL